MNTLVRQILGFWLVCALLIAAAIPAGFMPNINRTASADGTLYPLVLCTAYGEKTVYVPASQTPDAPAADPAGEVPAHSETAHSVCPFAPVLAQHTPAPVQVPAPFAYDVRTDREAADTLATAPIPHKSWQAQAPPLS